MLGGALKRLQQGAVSLALQGVEHRPRRLSPPPFQPLQQRFKCDSFDFRPLHFQGNCTQAGKQDIQVAHTSEQPRQPLEFNLELVSPLLVHEIL